MANAASGTTAVGGPGAAVRRLRRGLGLTQNQFAERLGVTPLTVHRWESGQSRPQRLAQNRLRELEEALAGQSAVRAPASPAAAPLDFAGAPEALAAVAEIARLRHGHQFNPAFATEIARIDPLPHQRIAVYERMLPQHPLRFLLADDAGAGKTIMTGLCIREMLTRGRAARVLIVPPAGLVGNWAREMREAFRLPFRIVAGSGVPPTATDRATTANPFCGPEGDLAIVSLDTLAGERTFDALRQRVVPPYDLIVFDEAHKLSVVQQQHGVRKRKRYQLAEALAGCPDPASPYAGLGWSAQHLLLLTATPHMGKDTPYHYLWRLLDPEVFAVGEAFRRFPTAARQRHFIRRTKEEMVHLDGSPLYRRRVCDTFSYDLSPGPDGEQALYDATTAYLRDGYNRALDNRPAVRLAMGVFQRRLASSTLAVLRSFERRSAKIEQHIDDLRAGRLSASELRKQQKALDRRQRDDFFDTHGADEDTGDDGVGERHEDYEDAMLGALAAVTIEELERERHVLAQLAARARRLIDAGGESKFERLREVLEDPRHAGEKWLVFTEHRDTADYLVRRLEGFGYAGHVAQIHGGLGWPAREAEIERFRRPDGAARSAPTRRAPAMDAPPRAGPGGGGARFLVATDAAGEGINLQFCRLMVNYDIPWNPARLEQRMGRIHRYGQRHDVRIFNLVAGGTHEGRVLRVLLDKLDAIRKELRSDKVFDVIGRLFEGRSLREHMAEALSGEGERRVIEHVAGRLTAASVTAVADAESRVYGAGGEVADRLHGLRDDMERERYLQLLPAYVRRLVEKSASLFDIRIHGEIDGRFSLAPGRPGALDALLPALERYPAAARERLSVRRPATDEPCIWLHPGEPVFDALADHVLRNHARDARRGGIFCDPKAEAPYLFHLGLAAAEQGGPEPDAAPRAGRAAGRPAEQGGPEPDAAPRAGRAADRPAAPEPGGPQLAAGRRPEPAPPGRAAGRSAAPEPGGPQLSEGRRPEPAPSAQERAEAQPPRVLEQRLFGLRQDADGAVQEAPVEHLLLLREAPDVAPGAVPLASRGAGLRAAAARCAELEISARLVEEQRAALKAELPERRRRIAVGFDLRAADLAKRRAALSSAAGRAADPAGPAAGEIDAIKIEQRALTAERRRALARTETAPDRVVPGPVRFLAHALVVPARASDELERYDTRVEEIAVRIAAAWERERGGAVRDVSRPDAARLAGLPDWPGFDLLATGPNGDVRSIEVKGRAGRSAVQMEHNEWKQAMHLEGRYWLYVVLDCATPEPLLVRVRDPFRRLLAKRRESSGYVISPASLIDAAEPA